MTCGITTEPLWSMCVYSNRIEYAGGLRSLNRIEFRIVVLLAPRRDREVFATPHEKYLLCSSFPVSRVLVLVSICTYTFASSRTRIQTIQPLAHVIASKRNWAPPGSPSDTQRGLQQCVTDAGWPYHRWTRRPLAFFIQLQTSDDGTRNSNRRTHLGSRQFML